VDRYVRQRSLAQVGDAGQARIEAARYRLGAPGAATTVEREYLERAGARHFETAGAPELVHARAFRNRAARDFATGAWRALAQLRQALEQDR
jgi:hypothetical protein